MSVQAGPGIDWAFLAKMAPRTAIAGLAFGWLLAIAGDPARGEARPVWGGDYPAFHMAGKVLLAGRGGELYDLRVQQELQQGMPTDGFLPFLYPPFVAAFYAALAAFDYRTSYALFTLLSFAALAASVLLLRPVSDFVRSDPWRALALALVFYPVLRSSFGGQNTSFSILFVCCAWRLLFERRDLAAGLALGLLAFKPQFLVPIAGMLLLAGRPRVLAGAAVTSALLVVASMAISGSDWPREWWQAAQAFAEKDSGVNAANGVALGQLAELAGAPSLALPISLAVSLLAAGFAWVVGRRDFFRVLALSAPVALLAAPHALFYDVGIALPALAFLADRGRGQLALLLWAAGMLAPLLSLSAMSPLLFVVLAIALGVAQSASAATSASSLSRSSSLSVE